MSQLRHTAGDLARMLAFNMQALCVTLLPAGSRRGQEWVHASLDGGTDHGLSVHLGSKAENGIWRDFGGTAGGDALDLVAHVLYRGDKKAAYAWAMRYLGLSNDAAPQAVQRSVAPPRTRDDAGENTKRALALFLDRQAVPFLIDTPADFYLRARGIDLRHLRRQPRALRYHPGCYCAEINARLPALLAAVCDAAGEHVATHRTWIAQNPAGIWGKAPLKEPKKSIGRLHGGTIRLARGASNKPLRDAPAGEAVVIGEGIETCMSVAIACPELRVLCGVSIANAASIVLPEQIGEVVLLADNDGANPAAARGLARVIAQLGQRHVVRLARSPWGKDFNDALKTGLLLGEAMGSETAPLAGAA